MFVRETVEEGVRKNGLLVPQRGVTHDQKGQAVALVVGKDGKVEQRVLSTDQVIGDDWLISAGLVDGDRVIVDGLQKVKPGTEVTFAEAAPTLAQPAANKPVPPPDTKN
jgi:membrane fusion protein (multidrug efflux system)